MWIQIIAYIVIGLYTLTLAYITFYCLLQFHLLLKYHNRIQQKIFSHSLADTDKLPVITIQLPLYNEPFVAARLIDNIVLMNYPKNKLEIQILDDSTDDTRAICEEKVTFYTGQGFDIKYFHRSQRDGYKAGALSNGLKSARGEYIAIFDADFLPQEDFLLQTISHFNDPQVGVVQTRWAHINGDYSLITRLQAFQLNVHFTIEQTGRSHAGYLLQFNGTAGVWRKQAIIDAGGWTADTLTEDLDLSIRAQLKGWQIKYIQEVTSPAELPSEMSGLKSQQFRWMKGGAENARRLIPSILKSDMPFSRKIHATTHLLSSSVFLGVFALGILSVPALFLMGVVNIDVRIYAICMISILTAGIIYYVANKDTCWSDLSTMKRIKNFIILFPLFLSFSMGLSLHNSIAVIQGFRGKRSPFVRTPKFNMLQLKDRFAESAFPSGRITIPATTIIEGLLALYFLTAVIAGIQFGKTSFVLYHLMLMTGFGSIFFYSIKRAPSS